MSANAGEETVIRTGTLIPGGKAVEGGRGWAWIAAGWELFKRAPGTWIGMIVVYVLISIALAIVPVIGAIASHVLLPVFAGGWVIASRRADQGEAPLFADLFAGFQNKFGVLATVGAIWVGAALVIAFGVLLITGVGMFSMVHAEQASPAALGAALVAILVILALMVPVMMALWFAAPLVLFHEHGAVAAMKASFSGCLKNVVPFLLYSLVALVFGFLASVPLGIGWLVFGPVLAASVYTAYKDIYLG